MTRFSLATALALAAGAGAGALLPAAVPPAEAVTAAAAIGTYQLKVKGEGWAARAGKAGDANRFSGLATLVVRARDPQVNDGLVTVEVTLDPALRQSLLGGATPSQPQFVGTAAPQGDWLALIDAGQPTFVNAMNLRFDARGRKLTGSWMAVFPAREGDLATQQFATGVTATFTGRRTLRARR